MHNEVMTAAFPPATEQDWRALVAKTLRDAPFESLTSVLADGVAVQPLYAAGDAPAPLAFTPRPVSDERAWDVRVVVAHPEPSRANAEILRDLEGGAASVLVRIDPTGGAGVAIGSADGLARTLDQVILELAPVALDAGFLGPRAADWLAAAAKASPSAKLIFHLDPLSAFAEAGASPGPIESHLDISASTAARLAEAYPQAGLFLASGRVAHEAGDGEAGELAFAFAAALAYAKAQVRTGRSIADAFRGVTLGFAADSDYFTVIAKLRAARVLWARMTDACGVAVPARIEARSSRRMLTAQDPWTNMLRLTAAGFAAAVGGADAVALGCYTDALGHPTAFARRQSRNTQLILMEEAHLGRVVDPAAGSSYIESLTDALARAAWNRFQGIEAQGGIVAALISGHVAAEVEKVRAARRAAGEPKILGVTTFAPAAPQPVEVEPVERKQVEAPSPRLPGADSACPPLSPTRLSEPYEAAR